MWRVFDIYVYTYIYNIFFKIASLGTTKVVPGPTSILPKTQQGGNQQSLIKVSGQTGIFIILIIFYQSNNN